MGEVAKIMGPFEKQPKPNAAKFPYALSWKWRILRLGQTRSIIVSIRISSGVSGLWSHHSARPCMPIFKNSARRCRVWLWLGDDRCELLTPSRNKLAIRSVASCWTFQSTAASSGSPLAPNKRTRARVGCSCTKMKNEAIASRTRWWAGAEFCNISLPVEMSLSLASLMTSMKASYFESKWS